jgi:hypothetical protein
MIWDQVWSPPPNLQKTNTEEEDLSKDGKYLFFNAHKKPSRPNCGTDNYVFHFISFLSLFQEFCKCACYSTLHNLHHLHIVV